MVFKIKLDLQKSSEFQSIEKYFNKMADTLDKINMENIHSKKVLENKNLEIEAAYNQMMAINETLIATYKELEESEDKYRKIFDYAPAGMMIFDIKNKKIVESNKEFLNIIEIKKENIEEIQIKEIFQQVDLEEIKNKIKEEKIIYNMELDLKKPLKSIIFSAIPQSLNKFKVLIAIKDITELKEMQKKLKEYAKNLEKKVEDRTKKLQEANEKIKLQQGDLVKSAYNKGLIEVTSGMMHNIGNVVNILHLNLEEIYNEIPKEESKIVKFFRNIVYNKIKGFPNKDVELEKIIDVMPQIINLLSDFEKKLKNNLRFILKKSTHVKEIIQLQQNFVGELGTEDYNEIDEIINEVVEIYGLYQGKKNIKLELNLNAKKKILCDKSQIVQVIGNLVKNSYEAIEEKKEKNGLVKISTKLYKNNEIEINLEDNGIGVEPEKLKEIFEFGYSTKKGNLKGCGFGLHSSNGIIKKYGGRLEVFSEKNKGTKFKITLPLKRKEKQKSEEKNNFSDINNK
ncbi:MAG: hypothetical protein B6I28_02150 [Fusobacteriia bacterium 4572_132]|nr:MAG: hypothetical protein B6I28_02150 [Fusobacteriia bacterium 4572_132]